MKNLRLDQVGKIAHQGDIFIHKVSDKPIEDKTAPEVQDVNGRLVVHHGEAIGHYHTLKADGKAKLQILPTQSNVKKFLLTVFEETTLDHGDLQMLNKADMDVHDPITFTPGSYEIHTQQVGQGTFLRPQMD